MGCNEDYKIMNYEMRRNAKTEGRAARLNNDSR